MKKTGMKHQMLSSEIRKFYILNLVCIAMLWIAASKLKPAPTITTQWHAVQKASSFQEDNFAPSNGNHYRRKCMLIYIHFHKSGGTSMVEFMENKLKLKSRYRFSLRGKPKRGKDLSFRANSSNWLLIFSTANRAIARHRAGQPQFWKNLRRRGSNFLSLEYNFLTPEQFDNLSDSCIQFWTYIRDPWRRFRSTYERELQMECQNVKKNARNTCVSENSLENWMKPNNIKRQYPRNNSWGGILHPNYYVRMLNGINDRVMTEPLTEVHLERAKSVLRRLDLVLLMEKEVATKRRIGAFFNATMNEMPHKSNNALKAWPMYDAIVAEANKQRVLFEEQNVLDRMLYNFVQDELLKDDVE